MAIYDTRVRPANLSGMSGLIDSAALNPFAEAASSIQGSRELAERRAIRDAELDRQKVLQGREDALWNRQQAEQQAGDEYLRRQMGGREQLADATLAAERDKGLQQGIEDMSLDRKQQAAISGIDYKDAADLQKQMLEMGINPEYVSEIVPKVERQLMLGQQATSNQPVYETQYEMRQRAAEGLDTTPKWVMEDLRSAEAADVTARKEQTDALRDRLAKLDAEYAELGLEAAKEQSDLGSGSKSSKTKSLMGDPNVSVDKFARELEKHVSPFGIGWDAARVNKTTRMLKANEGWSSDKQKFVLENMARNELLGDEFEEPTEELINELGAEYDRNIGSSSSGYGDTTYRDALLGRAAGIGAQRDTLQRQLELAQTDPMTQRLMPTTAAMRSAITAPSAIPAVETPEPRGRQSMGGDLDDVQEEEVETAEVPDVQPRGDVYEEMTPEQQMAAERQSLIEGTRGQFDALYNKPNKTEEDWAELEELGQELDALTGRVSDYAPARSEAARREAIANPELVPREEAPLDALSNRVQQLWNNWQNRNEGPRPMEMGRTLEQQRDASEQARIQELLDNVQGKRTGLLEYPTQQEVENARTELRRMYLQNPTAFRRTYGDDIVDSIYGK